VYHYRHSLLHFLFRAEEERKKLILIRFHSQIKSIIEKLPRLTEADLERLGHRGALRLAGVSIRAN